MKMGMSMIKGYSGKYAPSDYQGIQWQVCAIPKATEEVLCREDRRVAYTTPRSIALGHNTTRIAHAKHVDVRSASLRTRRLSFCEAAIAARSSASSASSAPAAAPCSGGAYGVPQTAQEAAWAGFSIVQAGQAQGASAAYSISPRSRRSTRADIFRDGNPVEIRFRSQQILVPFFARA